MTHNYRYWKGFEQKYTSGQFTFPRPTLKPTTSDHLFTSPGGNHRHINFFGNSAKQTPHSLKLDSLGWANVRNGCIWNAHNALRRKHCIIPLAPILLIGQFPDGKVLLCHALAF